MTTEYGDCLVIQQMSTSADPEKMYHYLSHGCRLGLLRAKVILDSRNSVSKQNLKRGPSLSHNNIIAT